MVKAVTHEGIRAIDELATTFRWKLNFVTFPKGVENPPTELVNLMCISSGVPKREANQMIDVQIRGHHIKREGVVDTSHQITLTFIETISNPIRKWIKSWSEATWEYNTGKSQEHKNLNCTVQIESMDGRNNTVWTYTLYGCMLEDYDPGGEFGSESDAFKPTINLYYDDFKQG